MNILDEYLGKLNEAAAQNKSSDVLRIYLETEKKLIEAGMHSELGGIFIDFIGYFFQRNDIEKIIIYSVRFIGFIEANNLKFDNNGRIYYWTGATLNYLLEDYEAAIFNLEKEYEIYKLQYMHGAALGCRNNIAIIKIDQGYYQEGYDILVSSFNDINDEDTSSYDAIVIANLVNTGLALIKMKHFKEGLSFFEKAKSHPKFNEVPAYHVETEMYYGMYYEGIKKKKVALKHYKMALDQAEKYKMIHELRKIYKLLADLHRSMKNYEESIIFLEKYTESLQVAVKQVQKAILAKAEVELHLSEVVKESEKLKEQHEIIKMEADYDYLTGAYSRRYITDHLKKLFARSKEKSKSFSLLLLDIDNFKKINDTYGHIVGDRVISEMCEFFQSMLDPKQELGRIGGDEFIIAFEDMKKEEAKVCIDSYLERLSNHRIKIDSTEIGISISGGLTDNQALASSDISQMLYVADQALYKAKELGKNQYFIV